MKQVLLFTVEFLSAITLGTEGRCEAFSDALRAAIEDPLKTTLSFKVGELSSGLDTSNPEYPNHWVIEITCDNLAISKYDIENALKELKWMHVTSCRRQVQRIPDDIPADKFTSRLSDRTPEKRLSHRNAQERHHKELEEYNKAHYGEDRPHKN